MNNAARARAALPTLTPPTPPALQQRQQRRAAAVIARFSAVPAAIVDRPDDGSRAEALPLPRAVESAADDPLLHNPLARAERLGTGWFGVIAELDGVVVDSTLEAHKQAWRAVAAEMGLPAPLGSALERINGVRDEVVIQQLFHWTRNPTAAAAIAARKEALYDELVSVGRAPAEAPGVRAFLETLRAYRVPVAAASALPERRARALLERTGLARAFDAVVSAEDNATPDLETAYLAASHQLARPPLRCVVLGDSNRAVEAAKELGMRAVVVTGGQPAWHFAEADLVVRGLGQLSLVNLKGLFGQEDLVEPSVPWEEVKASRAAADGEDADGRAAAAFGGGGLGGSFHGAAPRHAKHVVRFRRADADDGASAAEDNSGDGVGGDSYDASPVDSLRLNRRRSSRSSYGSSSSFGSSSTTAVPAGAAALKAGGSAASVASLADSDDDGESGWRQPAPWPPADDYQEDDEEEGGERAGAALTAAAAADEDDDFDVILPPKGAAIWDLQR